MSIKVQINGRGPEKVYSYSDLLNDTSLRGKVFEAKSQRLPSRIVVVKNYPGPSDQCANLVLWVDSPSNIIERKIDTCTSYVLSYDELTITFKNP